ncbi:YkgJ family cysteine cluster protein [Dyella ginsengisoli]|uniref:YkgJ family cysteine cluster protein n=1 Tax=Dyella ginsengisoli TaxID=363848 RepID=UPI0009FFD755|nr:YkgJ family cysteine cluster protein [Dyella ginsengisoli]
MSVEQASFDYEPEINPDVAVANAKNSMATLAAEIPGEVQVRGDAIPHTVASTPGSAIKKLRVLHREMDLINLAVAPYTACRAECASCCHYNVEIFPIEAELIERRTGRGRNKSLGLPQDFHGTPCPFLAGGRCSIYEVRPMVCRKHVALTKTAYWCHPDRSNSLTLPLAGFDTVDRAFVDIVLKDGRSQTADIRQFFSAHNQSKT